MHQGHHFLSFRNHDHVSVLLCSFLLMYGCLLKSNDCVYFSLLLKSICSCHLALDHPFSVYPNTSSEDFFIFKLPVPGFYLPENVLFKCSGVCVCGGRVQNPCCYAFLLHNYWLSFVRGGKCLPMEWQSPDLSLEEITLFMVHKVLFLLGCICRQFHSIKRLLQETCDEVSQTFSWQVSQGDQQLNVGRKPSGT